MQPVREVPGVKQLIAVGSGKGGVGKSTVAVNLALALAAQGRKVGLLDADIYGPSLPTLLGNVNFRPAIVEQDNPEKQKKILPAALHGLLAMSIGWLVDPSAAMIWRGPMATSALHQLLYDTLWGELDELVIDLPPGTGDIHLTLAQKMPVTGAVIVTTPQDLALADARRAIEMFQKVKIPVMGVIENMGLHVCSQCGHEERIFGEGGGNQLAEQYRVPLLGSLPLSGIIRRDADQGCPTVVADPAGLIAQLYGDIARQIVKLQEESMNIKFPDIVVRND